MVLPGPEAQQLATYIGWLMHRTWGGIVAGVILNLAVFSGYHVLWHADAGTGPHERFDWIAALIAIGAGIALFRYKRNVIHVIGACGAIGLALKLAGIA